MSNLKEKTPLLKALWLTSFFDNISEVNFASKNILNKVYSIFNIKLIEKIHIIYIEISPNFISTIMTLTYIDIDKPRLISKGLNFLRR